MCSSEYGGSQSGGGIGGRFGCWGVAVSVVIVLLLECCMPVVGIFSCDTIPFLVVIIFCGERLRRIGVREGVLNFRCVVGLLWFVLCR